MIRSSKRKVYIAGKYNDTNVVAVLNNIKMGIRVAVRALHEGFIPFCPFLDFMFQLVGDEGLTEEQFKAYYIEWLLVCDEIWLLPGYELSKGTMKELALAQVKGMKVVVIAADQT